MLVFEVGFHTRIPFNSSHFQKSEILQRNKSNPRLPLRSRLGLLRPCISASTRFSHFPMYWRQYPSAPPHVRRHIHPVEDLVDGLEERRAHVPCSRTPARFAAPQDEISLRNNLVRPAAPSPPAQRAKYPRRPRRVASERRASAAGSGVSSRDIAPFFLACTHS